MIISVKQKEGFKSKAFASGSLFSRKPDGAKYTLKERFLYVSIY